MISTGSGVSEPDSSDEEASERSRYRVEIVPAPMEEAAPAPAPATAPHDRRKMFAKSKSMKNCFSMPAPVGSGYCYQSPPPHDSMCRVSHLCRVWNHCHVFQIEISLSSKVLSSHGQPPASPGPPNIYHQ